MIRPALPLYLQESLQAAMDGLSLADEAARAYIHPDTVKRRRKLLLRALGVSSREQAVVTGLRMGLLELDPLPLPLPGLVIADRVPLQELRQARLRAGLTLAAAAVLIGRSKGWLSQAERGLRRFGWAELRTYAARLGADFDWSRP